MPAQPAAKDRTVYIVHPEESWRDTLTLRLGIAGYAVCQLPSIDALMDAGQVGLDCALVALPLIDQAPDGWLSALRRRLPVILLAGNCTPEDVRKGFLAGASDVLPGSQVLDEVGPAIERLWAAPSAKPPVEPSADPRGVWSDLTRRETEVAQWVRRGYDNRAIATRLGISHRTVEVHKTRMMRKLGAQTLSDLIAMPLREKRRKMRVR